MNYSPRPVRTPRAAPRRSRDRFARPGLAIAPRRGAFVRHRDAFVRPGDPIPRPRDPIPRPGDAIPRPGDAFERPRDPFTRPRDAFAEGRGAIAQARDSIASQRRPSLTRETRVPERITAFHSPKMAMSNSLLSAIRNR